jgi:hypothetical protein
MKRMSRKEMKRLALLKWEYIVKDPTSIHAIRDIFPELAKFPAACSCCEIYYYLNNCGRCPIKVNGNICSNLNHPFHRFIKY